MKKLNFLGSSVDKKDKTQLLEGRNEGYFMVGDQIKYEPQLDHQNKIYNMPFNKPLN